MNDPCIRPVHFVYTPATATVKEITNQGWIEFRLCTRCANELDAMKLSVVRIIYDVVETRTSAKRVKGQPVESDAS